MPIQTDFKWYPYSKVGRHVGNNDTVYSMVAFYSWTMDLWDEPAYHSYKPPMIANTPELYTMTNGWFMDYGDGSDILHYLYGGSIDTSGYTNDVLVLDYDTITTDFVSTDKDKTVLDDASAVGPLLTYKTSYEASGKGRIWVRDTNSNGQIADSSSVTISGSAEVDADGASFTGDDVYANVYTIADFPGSPNPQVYIRQLHPKSGADIRLSEWSNTDYFDPGTIDIIFPVKIGGVAIDSGNFSLYARQTGDTFTHTVSQVSTTGASRTPIGAETTKDEVNITKGEWYLLYDSGSAGGFSAGDRIQNVSTSSLTPPSWYAEVVAVDEFTVDTTGCLTLRALRGSISDNDTIYVGTTDEGTAVGTPGDTRVDHAGTGTEPVIGDIGLPFEGGSSGAHRVLRGYDNAENVLVMQVHHTHGTLDSQDYTGSGRDVLYRDFSSGEVVDAPTSGTGLMSVTTSDVSTTLISGYSDITIAHISGTVTVSSLGSFTAGERITWNSGSSEAIYVKDNGSNEMTLANVRVGDEPDDADVFSGDISSATANCDSSMTDAATENFEFPLQTTGAEYAVFMEGGEIYQIGRSLSDIYAYSQYRCRDGETDLFYTSTGTGLVEIEGQFYIKALTAYAALKANPFGQLAGSTMLFAQGVWIQGQAAADFNNVKLTDHSGNLQQPYQSVTLTVDNTRVDDVIEILPRDASTGLVKEDQYASHATNNVQSGSTFDLVSGSFPIDTPTSGAFTVVDNTNNEQHRYRYASYSGGQLTLPTEVSGTGEAGSTGQTLVDTGVFASGVQRGDIIRRTTDHAWAYVVEVVDDDEITTTVLSNESDPNWDVGDTFEINSLVKTYDGSDTFFIAYHSDIEDTGTDGSPGVSIQQLTYSTDRLVIVSVRNLESANPIKHYETPQTIGTNGLNVIVNRNLDQVYTP